MFVEQPLALPGSATYPTPPYTRLCNSLAVKKSLLAALGTNVPGFLSGTADNGIRDIRDIPEGEIRALFNLIDKDKSGQLSASVSTVGWERPN